MGAFGYNVAALCICTFSIQQPKWWEKIKDVTTEDQGMYRDQQTELVCSYWTVC